MANLNHTDFKTVEKIRRQLEQLEIIQPSLSNSSTNGPRRNISNNSEHVPKSEKIKKVRRRPRSKKNNAAKSRTESDNPITMENHIAPSTQILLQSIFSDIPSTSRDTASANTNIPSLLSLSPFTVKSTPSAHRSIPSLLSISPFEVTPSANRGIPSLLSLSPVPVKNTPAKNASSLRDTPTHRSTPVSKSIQTGKNKTSSNRIFTNRNISSINKSTPTTSTSTPKKRNSFQGEKGKNTANNTPVKLIDIQNFNFEIKKVKNAKSIFIRKRNSVSKYINLKSFCSCKTAAALKPCVFTTSDKLTGSVTKVIARKEKLSKVERRRYPLTNLRSKTVQESATEPFPKYFNINDVTKGLAQGTLIKGFVRINPKNFRDSYVTNEDTSLSDYYLSSVIDRNRALEGDEVVLQLKKEAEWVNGKKTARVVFIKQMVHPRIVVGLIKPSKRKADYALLYPRDKRCPLLRIALITCPPGFKENPKQFENTLFVAKITDWKVPAFAHGIVTEKLGEAGDLKVETISILREFCLDITPFSDDIKEYLPKSKIISEDDMIGREDLRRDCIFTIDPETARDLDDAVSAKVLPNGNYEIGVHISDASYYLTEGTELDQIVSQKATTIYMVDNVYHMLPTELCLFCSLLPGEDKLAFSVFWEITAELEIVNTRFTRTIINSCAQLAYEHAQKVIDNPDGEFRTDEFPLIHNGFTVEDIVKTIGILQLLAIKLRQRRIDNGALKIDQVKLLFKLDRTGEPEEFWKYENKESHRLIEEFMLLANISVAEKITESFPNISFLRCHEPPKQTMLVDLKNSLASYGIHLDISSAGGISSSLKKYLTDDYAGFCRMAVLNHLTAKAMTRAKYFCAAITESEDEYKHYALSVPIYTHFTSPIRRYADIMVHRLLAASLNYQKPPEWDVDYVCAIAANCNKQKYNAKRAGEASVELYLAHYVEANKPFEQECVVVDVKERSFDAIALKTGSLVRIYKNCCEKGALWNTEVIPINKSEDKLESEKRQLKVTIKFPKTKQLPETELVVEIFSIVKINLEKKPQSYKLEGELVRPLPSQVFLNRQ